MKGAIFDMDGLLFDTEKVFQETWNEIAAERGLELSPHFKYEICGTSGPSAYEVVKRNFCIDDMEEAKEIAFTCYGRVYDKLAVSVDLKPGAEKILRMFRKHGIKTAVASSSSPEQIARNLRLTGFTDLFDAVASGKEVANGKPEPDIFLLAAERIAISPEECYVFEDSLTGIRAGHAAGMKPVMIPDLLQPDEETKALCHAVFETLDEASDRLEGELT